MFMPDCLIHFKSCFTFWSFSDRMTMEFLITLLLVSGLFPNALSLTCEQCVSLGFRPCTSTQINCKDQCATATFSVDSGATQVFSVKTCSMPDICFNGSLNFGSMNMISNAKCCSTDFCNNETLSVPQQTPNGMRCYTCDPYSCLRTMTCVGEQNYCISTTVQQGGSVLPMKGCASKSICDAAKLSSSGIALESVKCCQGNLCNGAESFTLSFLLMFIPLLSSILFY